MAWLLSPLAWAIAASALLALAWPRRRPRMLAAGILLAAVSFASMTPLAANLLWRGLEHAASMPPGCEGEVPAVALVPGGGFDGWPRHARDFSVLNLASRQRVERAVDWWRERPGRRLVLLGGSPHPAAPPVSGLMAAYAETLGVPAASITVEPRSVDTWGNAREAAAMSPPLPGRVVLVTSPVHVPRAQLALARHGFEACPREAGVRRLPSRLPWALVPRTSALARTEVALHEGVGLAYYRFLDARDPARAEPVRGDE
jgi:uncharacterized SAM-binding protein YcdF (DUF218 family)